MESVSAVIASIVLNDQDRTDLAAYGFRSWMLQAIDQPYEVVMNVFNPRRQVFDRLMEGRNPNCRVIINVFDPPAVFNISAANNMGLHTATGKYVLFANADIIYPSHFLARLLRDLERHDLHYVAGTRINLTPEQTDALPKPETRTLQDNFDSLEALLAAGARANSFGVSPWVARRDTAIAIGGFDSNVYCSEDGDMNDRIMHYLRRTGKQSILYNIQDLAGYHLHHKPSEIHAMGPAAWKIIVPRRGRLMNDPASLEDIVATPLDSREKLVAILKASAKPDVPLNKAAREILPWWLRQFLNRARKANRMLWKGQF